MRGPFRREDEGQAVVEFALVLPILMLVLLGLLQFGFLVNAKQQLEGVAREGAREYAVTVETDRAVRVVGIAGRQMPRFAELTQVRIEVSERRERVVEERRPRQSCSGFWFRRCQTVFDVVRRVETREEVSYVASGPLAAVRAQLASDGKVKKGEWVTVTATYAFPNPVRASIGGFSLPASIPITTRAAARVETDGSGGRGRGRGG